MEHKYNKGSEWRKWDLHLHTASSYDYKYKGADADDILIATLINVPLKWINSSLK
jgi:hypothetical protein